MLHLYVKMLYFQNFIRTFHHTVFHDVKKLKRLNAAGNLITSLSPILFRHQVELAVLDLGYCRISALPRTIFTGLWKLERLDLRGNGIVDLYPGMFIHQWSLETLLLNHNRIQHLADGTFEGLENLLRLEFEECTIMAIDRGVFMDTPLLEVLNLCDNQLKHLEAGVLNIGTLKSLSLDGNGLNALPRDFGMMTSLTDLDLSYNNLTSLDHCQFASLLKLRYLNIRENRFTCDCDLFWISAMHTRLWRQWESPGVPPFVSDRCHYPIWLRGINVEQQNDHKCMRKYTSTYEKCYRYFKGHD